MAEDNKTKQLMEGYVGVKFHAERLSEELPPGVFDLYDAFARNCGRLREHGMTPANGGNLSIRHGDGFVISSSGCNLGCIEQEELIFVERCDLESEHAWYRGPINPSSETFMHWLIFRGYPEANAIVHAHDEFATRPELLEGEVEQSEREEPYGTIELAHMAIATFKRAKRIIVLKNHGYVAIGPDFDKVCDLIIETHLRLLAKGTGK